MNFIIISSFLIFSIIFFFRLQFTKKKSEDIDRLFWEREQKANFTRKKPLDNLNYITIPENILSLPVSPDLKNGEAGKLLSELSELSKEKIVNLTGYTNTDLKLEYGTANITILSDYDFHYTKLVTLLQKLAELLCEGGEDALAVSVLEFAVETGTDVSKSYYLLASLYNKAGTPEKIAPLIDKAKNIKSLLRDSIVQKLKEAYL